MLFKLKSAVKAILSIAALGISSAHAETLSIIHLNDLHANLVSHNEMVRYEQGNVVLETRGGIARIKTVIDQIRDDAQHSLLLNVGDTYHGGVEATYTHGNAIVEAVNALGIDVGVPGNWDFAYGPGVARERYGNGVPWFMKWRMEISDIHRPNFPNLAANVTYTKPFWNSGAPFLPATMIKTFGGIKIGIIGITSDIVPKMHKMLGEGFKFTSGMTAYLKLITDHSSNLKRQGVNAVVVMSELGIHKDYRLANNLDRGVVDIFFSAHTHELTYKPLESKSGALVVEAGSDAYLGHMDLTFEGGMLTDRHWKIYHITEDIQEDPELSRLVAIARAPFVEMKKPIKLPNPFHEYHLRQPITKILNTVNGQIDRTNVLESTFNNAFSDLLRKRGRTDIALAPGFRFDQPIASQRIVMEGNPVISGPITIEDVYRFFPIIQKIAVGNTTGARLRQQLEKNFTDVFSVDVFRQWGGWVPGISGLELEVDLSHTDGDRIISMKLSGKNDQISPDTVISLTGCTRPGEDNDVLCAFSGFKDREELTATDGAPLYNIDLFVEGIVNGEFKPVDRHNIRDLSNFPFWPKTAFVQPLEGIGN
ncbi:MAG: hypothetical protein GY761_13615 [Hyphomicrobiales bacterium]|nr:hypothetical protein [Hyphomicrobiales bacterium]